MNINRLAFSVVLLSSASLCEVSRLQAATTIDSVHRYAYGENIGWMDWYNDGTDGAVIGNYACSGYVYGANVGWINLGNGSPANGIRYLNNSTADFGVNNDGLGNLRGYAWGANIGWISFEDTGAPTVNLATGQLSGYVWSANCAWITLSNACAFVQTDTLFPGPLAADGLPCPWLLSYFGTTDIDPNSDPDHTGMTVRQDYLAGLDPTNPDSKLAITGQAFAPGASATITWSSVATRLYYIEKTDNLASPDWQDSGLGLITPDGTTTTRSFVDTGAPARFYRVEAVLPLAP